MKKYTLLFVAILATTLLTSCGGGNDPDNPVSTDPYTDTGVVINGVKWATRNVDAPGKFTTSSEKPGMLYQWNIKVGWSSTDPMVNSNGSNVWPEYLEDSYSYYSHIEKGFWEEANDPSPVGWRLATAEDLKTLFDKDKVSSEWTTKNGVNGRKFTDKNNGNTLFIPANPTRDSHTGTLRNVNGTVGYYWVARMINFDLYYWSIGPSVANYFKSADNINYQQCYALRCVAK